jgi:phosphoribosylformylglycinamidine synthase I
MSANIKPKALVLHAAGSNRDPDACTALAMAGADPEIVHLNLLRRGERRWADYGMLVIPGGFSYADALGAGKLVALDLAAYFADEVQAFVDSGKPVIGICNGFQVLVKSGILPGGTLARAGFSCEVGSDAGTEAGRDAPAEERHATLAHNANGRFECRWVSIAPVSRSCLWTTSISAPVFCPVAHGEGRFTVDSGGTLEALRARGQIAFIYAAADGRPAGGGYPANPNGSVADIAGVCNEAGNVLGLMPHPENSIYPDKRPRVPTGSPIAVGLEIFKNGVEYAAESRGGSR